MFALFAPVKALIFRVSLKCILACLKPESIPERLYGMRRGDMQQVGNQTISVKESRKLLGTDAEALSNGQVLDIITSLSLIARKYLHDNGSKKRLGV